MSSEDGKFRVWDSYWREDRLYSGGVDADPQISATLDRYWIGILRRLSAGAAVLDVACGNGAVGIALARGARALGRSIAIAAIDEAAIDPPYYVPEHKDILSGINFRPRTQMEALPFEDASFDAMVSQFGIEFGNTTKALSEAARVLKPNGLLTFLVLPVHSAAVTTARKAVKQARYLLRETTLLNDASTIVKAFHESDPASREQKTRADLERFNLEVEKTVHAFGIGETDVVFTIIAGLNKVFVDRKTVSFDEQVRAVETVRTGLAQYAARAQATTKAALTETSLAVLKHTITASGFKLTETRSILVSDHGTVAWQLTAERLSQR